MSRIALAFVLSISLIATGCSAQWISVALADLPVLTQMALNIAALVSTLQSGKQLTPSEALAIQNISAEASKDLTLLQALYNAYKASPSADGLQKIETMIQETNQELPALLQAAHISDPALSARITAAVNLILTTCEQLRFADSIGLISCAQDGSTEHRHSPAQGPETAVESAGVRSQRQRSSRCGAQPAEVTVITRNRPRDQASTTKPETRNSKPETRNRKPETRCQSAVLGSQDVS